MNRKVFGAILGLCFLVVFGAYWAVTTQYGSSDEHLSFIEESNGAKPLEVVENPTEKDVARIKKQINKLRPSRAYIVIDTHANKLSYRTADSIMLYTDCSTGSGGELTDTVTGRRWVFDTPRGVFKVRGKMTEPWWRKPDWAFIEEGEAIPADDRERLDPEVMGDYALDFGDGYFIHGTIYERLLGVGVTHGCVRVGSKELAILYNRVPIGTPVYIF